MLTFCYDTTVTDIADIGRRPPLRFIALVQNITFNTKELFHFCDIYVIMVKCAAYGCNSNSERKMPGITFHRFPKNKEICSGWVKKMKIANWAPTQNDRLCSNHFEEHFFYKTEQKVKLLNEAIPTIFPELPTYLQPKKETRRRTREKAPGPQPFTGAQQDAETPREKQLRRKLFTEIVKSREKTRKIRVLGQSLKRFKKKVISLKQIINALDTKNLITEENPMLLVVL